MKKLLVLTVLIFLLFMPLASAAKTIVFITNSTTDSPCHELEGDEIDYCSHMESMGYNIKVINENHVAQDTSTWKNYVAESQMIFLGSISRRMVCTEQISECIYRDDFCGNIAYYITPEPGEGIPTGRDKELFATGINTVYDTVNEIKGCVFEPINLVNWNLNDNECPGKKTLKVDKEGFITENYEKGDYVQFYYDPQLVRIHKISDGGWFTAECTPDGIGFYPVINSSSRGVFWGLDNTDDFTIDAWDVFDRTVLTIMGDTDWVIEALTIPESFVTAGETIWVVGKATYRGQPITDLNGILNFTVGTEKYTMSYEDGFWKNTTFEYSDYGIKRFYVRGYEIDGEYKGVSPRLTRLVGEWVVKIDSEKYEPYQDYLINASFWSQGSRPELEPQTVYFAYYSILNSTDFSKIEFSTLNCYGSICNKTITPGDWGNNFILQVYSGTGGTGNAGGSFVIIDKSTITPEIAITTDKNTYEPGEAIEINASTTRKADQVNLTIITPEDEDNLGEMKKVTDFLWNESYSLGTGVPQGTYKIKISARIQGTDYEATKNVEVLAWNAYIFLGGHDLDAGDDLEINIGTIDVFDDNIDFDYSIHIVDPDDGEERIDHGTFEGEYELNTTYTVPEEAEEGQYRVKLFIKEDDGTRNRTLYENFTVNVTEPGVGISVTPSIWKQVTTFNKKITKTFTINNEETTTATDITITPDSDIDDIIDVISKPTSISADSSDDLKLEIDTTGLGAGDYTGEIMVASSVGSDVIDLDLEVVGDLAARADDLLDDLHDLASNITALGDQGEDVSELWDDYNDTEDDLNDVKSKYNNGYYKDARDLLSSAESNLASLRSSIEYMETGDGEVPTDDYSWIIWAVAGIVVIVVVAILVIRYRDKIMGLIKRLLGREEDEEYEEEYYYYPEGGEYRTEYY